MFKSSFSPPPAFTFVSQFCTRNQASPKGLSATSKSRLSSSWRILKRKPQERWAAWTLALMIWSWTLDCVLSHTLVCFVFRIIGNLLNSAHATGNWNANKMCTSGLSSHQLLVKSVTLTVLRLSHFLPVRKLKIIIIIIKKHPEAISGLSSFRRLSFGTFFVKWTIQQQATLQYKC